MLNFKQSEISESITTTLMPQAVSRRNMICKSLGYGFAASGMIVAKDAVAQAGLPVWQHPQFGLVFSVGDTRAFATAFVTLFNSLKASFFALIEWANPGATAEKWWGPMQTRMTVPMILVVINDYKHDMFTWDKAAYMVKRVIGYICALLLAGPLSVVFEAISKQFITQSLAARGHRATMVAGVATGGASIVASTWLIAFGAYFSEKIVNAIAGAEKQPDKQELRKLLEIAPDYFQPKWLMSEYNDIKRNHIYINLFEGIRSHGWDSITVGGSYINFRGDTIRLRARKFLYFNDSGFEDKSVWVKNEGLNITEWIDINRLGLRSY